VPSADAQAKLCISIHDVAPATWPACQRLLGLLDELGGPPVTLLVVPDYHHQGRIDRHMQFLRALDQRQSRGDELVLHGYHHVDEEPATGFDRLRRRLYTAGEGEFAALTAAAAAERLDAGLRLTRRLGWEVSGFVAPAWLMSAGTRQALAATPLRYTTTLKAFIGLPHWRVVAAPTLVYSVRARWRRVISRLWNRRLYRCTQRAPTLRIGLHPADAGFADVLEDWRRLIGRALEHRQPVTKRAVAEALA
jgi:predicted deacetylase